MSLKYEHLVTPQGSTAHTPKQEGGRVLSPAWFPYFLVCVCQIEDGLTVFQIAQKAGWLAGWLPFRMYPCLARSRYHGDDGEQTE